jgi:hypothetical protein
VDLHVDAIQKRDLSLTKSLDSNKGFTESRTTIKLNKGEIHFVDDITSTEMQTIDDLKKVKGVLEELMRSQYYHQTSSVFKELEFVINWPTFDREKKD